MRPLHLTINFPAWIHDPNSATAATRASTVALGRSYLATLLKEFELASAKPTWRERPIPLVTLRGWDHRLLPSDMLGRLVELIGIAFPQSQGAKLVLETPYTSLTIQTLEDLLACGVDTIKLPRVVLRDRPNPTGHSALYLDTEPEYCERELSVEYGDELTSLAEFRARLVQTLHLSPSHVEFHLARMITPRNAPRLSWLRRTNEQRPDLVGRLQERLELGHLVLSAVDLDHLAVNTFAAPACSTAPIVSSAEPYDELGLGIGAESRIWRSESRLLSVSNAAALPHYTALLHNNALPWAKANVTPQAQIISDYVEKSMRTLAGVDTRRFEARFGVPFEYYYPGLARVLTDCGFVEQNGFSIRLSERGRVVADNVVSNFKLDPAEFEPIASARPEALLKVEMPELLVQHS